MNPSTFYEFDIAIESYTFGSHLELGQDFSPSTNLWVSQCTVLTPSDLIPQLPVSVSKLYRCKGDGSNSSVAQTIEVYIGSFPFCFNITISGIFSAKVPVLAACVVEVRLDLLVAFASRTGYTRQANTIIQRAKFFYCSTPSFYRI
jgi:hypothetical protein